MAPLRYLSLPCACLIFSGSLAARDYSPLLTGEVFSRTAQDIFVPHSQKWRANISMMAPEGTEVKPGDVVVAFDGTATMNELEQGREQRRAEEAIADRDLARLQMELTQARFAVDQARVALELAIMKAEIPKGLIGALEHSDNQLTKEQGSKLLKNALKQLAERQQNLLSRQEQEELDQQKAELNESWLEQMLDRMTVRAEQSGFMIHSHHPWTRAKFQEGDTVRTSFKVAEVADTHDLAIRVWVNGVDRPHIEANVPVIITLDALPEKALTGHLETLSDSATKRQEWGKAAYFEGTVTFGPEEVQGVLPGMSALVEFQ